MKLLLVLALCGCMAAHAAECETSTLVIHTDKRMPIKVYVDGSTGDNPASIEVTVRGLDPGRHELKVVETYPDRHYRPQQRTVYTGTIEVRASMYMVAHVDEGKGVGVHQTKMSCDEQSKQGLPLSGDAEAPYGDNNVTDNGPAPSHKAPPAAAPIQPDHSQDYRAPEPPHSGLSGLISDADFDLLKNGITAARYETRKMDTLKTLSDDYQFTTVQVGMLMGLFAFESNKLDVAKLLYSRTTDPQNYPTLARHFNFEARKQDFQKFLQGR